MKIRSKISRIEILVFAAILYLFYYCIFFQWDYIVYSLSKNQWFIETAKIENVYIYEDTWRTPYVVRKTADIIYTIDGVDYRDTVNLSFDEDEESIIHIAVKKSDHNKARRCEVLGLGKARTKMMHILEIIVIVYFLVFALKYKQYRADKMRDEQ